MVEYTDVIENNEITEDGEHLIIYIPINQRNEDIRKMHLAHLAKLLGVGWIHGGDIKLKDFSDNEAVFSILKASLKE